MKLGVSSHSFRRLVKSGAMTEIQVPAKAKEIGFDVIEFSTLTPPPGQTPQAFAPRLREECKRVGLKVANYATGGDFLQGFEGNWRAETDRLREEVRIANMLGAPCMRHDATRGPCPDGTGPRSFDEALETLAHACRSITQFAQDFGIRTMVENHGFFCQESTRVERLVSTVGHPNFGVLVDMGNFLCADEDPAEAVGRLMPFAFHVHAKDFHFKSGCGVNPGQGWFRSRAGNYLRGAIIGHGDVAVSQCIGIMKRSGYDGVISMEFEGMEDPIEGMSVGLENLRRYVEEA